MAQPNPQPAVNSNNTVWIYLSYILAGFIGIPGLIGLLVVKDDNEVRFHCAQGMAFGVVVFLVNLILGFTVILPILIGIAAFVYGILLAIKAGKGEHVKIPVLGDFTEKNLMNLFK